MALKKSELYSSLWKSCDELRGGMDASQYKDYVLVLLFIKYISDKYADSDDFAPPVVIPKGASFKDMIALKGKAEQTGQALQSSRDKVRQLSQELANTAAPTALLPWPSPLMCRAMAPSQPTMAIASNVPPPWPSAMLPPRPSPPTCRHCGLRRPLCCHQRRGLHRHWPPPCCASAAPPPNPFPAETTRARP